MAFIGLTVEKEMYFGAKRELINQARELRKKMTPSEEILWQYLRNRKVGNMKFRRQHPIAIFIADFYCHEARLIIELDGDIHNSPEVSERDEGRTWELENLGLKVIRFRNEEVYNDIEKVIDAIILALK